MESAKPSVYTDGNSGGIDRVRKEDGFYAFFMEAAVIEYHIERKCDLTMIGGLLDSKGYGIALPLSKLGFFVIQPNCLLAFLASALRWTFFMKRCKLILDPCVD